MNLIDPELYGEYSTMNFTKRGIDIQYWLENVVSKYEAKKIDTFGKLDGMVDTFIYLIVDYNQITKEKIKRILRTQSSFKYFEISENDNRLNESKLTTDSIPKVNINRRSFSSDKLKKREFYDLISIEPHKTKYSLDPKYERKQYLKHLSKLQIAHQKQLDAVKHIVIDISDQIITKKIVGYQQSINVEIKRIFDYINSLKEIISSQKEESFKLCRIIQQYETNVTEKTIKYVFTKIAIFIENQVTCRQWIS